ncbi:hypothetical protein FB451DRAFT_1495067 [Mycena latifolia]|nr:hypothetical protein FB451DRAFT_1495067 [Mycena latifolia]
MYYGRKPGGKGRRLGDAWAEKRCPIREQTQKLGILSPPCPPPAELLSYIDAHTLLYVQVLMGFMCLSLHGIEGAFVGTGAKTGMPAKVGGEFSNSIRCVRPFAPRVPPRSAALLSHPPRRARPIVVRPLSLHRHPRLLPRSPARPCAPARDCPSPLAHTPSSSPRRKILVSPPCGPPPSPTAFASSASHTPAGMHAYAIHPLSLPPPLPSSASLSLDVAEGDFEGGAERGAAACRPASAHESREDDQEADVDAPVIQPAVYRARRASAAAGASPASHCPREDYFRREFDRELGAVDRGPSEGCRGLDETCGEERGHQRRVRRCQSVDVADEMSRCWVSVTRISHSLFLDTPTCPRGLQNSSPRAGTTTMSPASRPLKERFRWAEISIPVPGSTEYAREIFIWPYPTQSLLAASPSGHLRRGISRPFHSYLLKSPAGSMSLEYVPGANATHGIGSRSSPERPPSLLSILMLFEPLGQRASCVEEFPGGLVAGASSVHFEPGGLEDSGRFCLARRGLGLHSALRTLFFFFAFPFIRLTFTVDSGLGPRKRATWLEAIMDLPPSQSGDRQRDLARAHTDALFCPRVQSDASVAPKSMSLAWRESRWFKPDAVEIDQSFCMDLPFRMWMEQVISFDDKG